VIEKLRTSWRSYREKRRQYQIERALYKAGGNPTGPTATAEHVANTLRASGAAGHWRVEPPTGKVSDPREK
jgi:hypothetical protein